MALPALYVKGHSKITCVVRALAGKSGYRQLSNTSNKATNENRLSAEKGVLESLF